jgi:hypothetical protein
MEVSDMKAHASLSLQACNALGIGLLLLSSVFAAGQLATNSFCGPTSGPNTLWKSMS